MVHSGFEASAVADAVARPWKAVRLALRGVRTEGPMAPDIPLSSQRPAEYVFSRHVSERLEALTKNLAT
jgi:hypothetical protein